MRTATDLLAEMLAIHADPQKGAAELYWWLHRAVDEVKECVERGDDTARLDWFSEQHGTQHPVGDVSWCTHSIDVPQFTTLREKIDRARGEGE
jgi:hypothetical protein